MSLPERNCQRHNEENRPDPLFRRITFEQDRAGYQG